MSIAAGAGSWSRQATASRLTPPSTGTTCTSGDRGATGVIVGFVEIHPRAPVVPQQDDLLWPRAVDRVQRDDPVVWVHDCSTHVPQVRVRPSGEGHRLWGPWRPGRLHTPETGTHGCPHLEPTTFSSIRHIPLQFLRLREVSSSSPPLGLILLVLFSVLFRIHHLCGHLRHYHHR